MNDPGESGSCGNAVHDTRASILSGMRLSKDDERRKDCRSRFFHEYQPRLFVFLMKKGLNDHDAEDLASDLLAKLLVKMDNFEYDPSKGFRSYLHTAARNALKDFWKENAKRRTGTGVDLDQQVEREDLQRRLEEQFDLDLLEEAKRRVRSQVADRDWKIFDELTESSAQITAEQLAERLGVKRHTVDVAKSRVISRLKAEIRKLEQQGPQEP